jgi:hypothetical protein
MTLFWNLNIQTHPFKQQVTVKFKTILKGLVKIDILGAF